MKEFVFLYPIHPYVDAIATSDAPVQALNGLIEERYRQRGFRVSWVMFSDPNNRAEADLSIKAPGIIIYDSDRIIPSGVTFLEAGNKYPDWNSILDQLPVDLKQLIIGGFHQWDCVDQLASAAYMRGLSVTVDEDTTELAFFGADTGYKSTLLERLSQEARANKPWFTQK